MLITFTLSHIYCEVVKRVGSNYVKMTTESEQKSVFPLFLSTLVAADQKAHLDVYVG